MTDWLVTAQGKRRHAAVYTHATRAEMKESVGMLIPASGLWVMGPLCGRRTRDHWQYTQNDHFPICVYCALRARTIWTDTWPGRERWAKRRKDPAMIE